MAREPAESTDLVAVDAREGGRLPDAYEREFMAGEGTVLHREKHRAPRLMHAIFGAAVAVVIGSAIATGQVLGVAFALPVLALAWLMFSVLRVTVSSGAVNVQYGLFGPTIPTAAIESAEATAYDWKKFGGWGIRRGRGGEWIYNMPGDGGRAVRIVWRDRKGRRRVTLIGSPRADALAGQIGQAQRALPAGARPKALESGE